MIILGLFAWLLALPFNQAFSFWQYILSNTCQISGVHPRRFTSFGMLASAFHFRLSPFAEISLKKYFFGYTRDSHPSLSEQNTEPILYVFPADSVITQ
jgi:hypothetical protein